MLESKLEYRTFLLLLAVVTIAFAWLLLPFYGAVFWGTILAIIFAPLQRRLRVRLHGRNNLAALISLTICLLIVILPMTFIAGALVQEGATVYQRL
ncbi:AI-2E family transporter, partial [Pseudomonas sp. ATCC 13867]